MTKPTRMTAVATALLLCAVLGSGSPSAATTRSDSSKAAPPTRQHVGQQLAQPGDWPRQDFDLHNDSFNRYETAISPANVADLKVSWSVPLDSGPDARAGPIVVGGMVYVGTHSRVFAFDSATGAERWEFAVGRNNLVTGIASQSHHQHTLQHQTAGVLGFRAVALRPRGSR